MQRSHSNPGAGLILCISATVLSLPGLLRAQTTLAPEAQSFVSISDPAVALLHIRVIDGTGAPARADQTLVIDHGTIAALGDAAQTTVAQGVRQLDLKGYTVYPGLVGMHEHLFYPLGRHDLRRAGL